MYGSKHWFNTFALFAALLFVNAIAKAQQAKAYQTVHYRAKTDNSFFLLEYADGYIGANRIRLRLMGKKHFYISLKAVLPKATTVLTLSHGQQLIMGTLD
jgi:hypothetical protein